MRICLSLLNQQIKMGQTHRSQVRPNIRTEKRNVNRASPKGKVRKTTIISLYSMENKNYVFKERDCLTIIQYSAITM